MEKILKIEGMHCESCAKVIENTLEERGVLAAVDFKSGKARIIYDEDKLDINQIKHAIEKEGYRVK